MAEGMNRWKHGWWTDGWKVGWMGRWIVGRSDGLVNNVEAVVIEGTSWPMGRKMDGWVG